MLSQQQHVPLKCSLAGMQSQDEEIMELRRLLAQHNQEHSHVLAAFEAERGDWEMSEKVGFNFCLSVLPEIKKMLLLST